MCDFNQNILNNFLWTTINFITSVSPLYIRSRRKRETTEMRDTFSSLIELVESYDVFQYTCIRSFALLVSQKEHHMTQGSKSETNVRHMCASLFVSSASLRHAVMSYFLDNQLSYNVCVTANYWYWSSSWFLKQNNFPWPIWETISLYPL